MVITSAPGKILWIGGYSVLEKGNVSFVTGVDKRVYAKADKSDEIHLKLSQFSVELTGKFDGHKLIFDNMTDDEKKYSSFVRVAVETCLRYFKHKGIAVSGVSIETISDPAFGFGETKTGLGSSAAVTTATIAALFELHGLSIEHNRDMIHKMAQYMHFRVQGKVGSGFDIAASCFGAIAYSRYSPELIKDIPETASIKEVASAVDKEWDYSAEHIALPYGFLASVGNFIGESASTSAMVKKINEWKTANPDEYKALMKELNNANIDALKWLRKINEIYDSDSQCYDELLSSPEDSEEFIGFKQAFNKGRLLTKKLGELSGAAIESDEYSQIIEETMKHGAFVAKLPGAGGGDNISAISLSKSAKHKTEHYWTNCVIKEIEPVPISINNEGVRIEDNGVFSDIRNIFLNNNI
ncbi:MAG: hypothetical protein HZB65_00950 [Candidatus Aenigmarchaeota archaeon]|nr:hypothetical protein [Candidatus Aenigmarchaeota archaeon]